MLTFLATMILAGGIASFLFGWMLVFWASLGIWIGSAGYVVAGGTSPWTLLSVSLGIVAFQVAYLVAGVAVEALRARATFESDGKVADHPARLPDNKKV